MMKRHVRPTVSAMHYFVIHIMRNLLPKHREQVHI
jgi:hypothetical protein